LNDYIHTAEVYGKAKVNNLLHLDEMIDVFTDVQKQVAHNNQVIKKKKTIVTMVTGIIGFATLLTGAGASILASAAGTAGAAGLGVVLGTGSMLVRPTTAKIVDLVGGSIRLDMGTITELAFDFSSTDAS